MSKIELRLSNVDPPLPEPKRTIYRDIVNLPDPVKLGITIRYFNHDDVGLYFRITGSGTGYTFGTVDLGFLASGTDAYINLDEFASRAKPSSADLPNGEKEENITLILKAYTDSGYTNLKWTFERVVTVHWINSADAAFTVDELDNFDDGTVQGWGITYEAGASGDGEGLNVATDYTLSPPYSLKATGRYTAFGEARFRVYKTINTPNKDKIFAVADVRNSMQYIGGTYGRLKYLKIQNGDTVLIFLGRPFDTVGEDYIPKDKWIRIVVPLPRNTAVDFRIIQDNYGGQGHRGYLWLDDFKIISK